jgi:hypothetical protein
MENARSRFQQQKHKNDMLISKGMPLIHETPEAMGEQKGDVLRNAIFNNSWEKSNALRQG